MTTRPDLHVAVAGQKSRASDYNENFEMMLDYCDSTVEECEQKKQELIDVAKGYMPEIVAGQKGYLYSNGTTNSYCGTLFSINNGEESILNAPGSGNVTNPFQMPVMTENGTMGGDDFAVGCNPGGLNPYQCLDGQGTSTYFQGSTSAYKVPTELEPQYIEFYSPNGLNFSQFTIHQMVGNVGQNGYYTKAGKIEVSNDGINYTTATTYTAENIATPTINVEYSGYYKYTRFTSTQNDYNRCWAFYTLSAKAVELISVSTADKLYFNVGGAHKNLIYTNALGTVRNVDYIKEISTTNKNNGTYYVELPDEGNKATLLNGEILKSPDLPILYAWSSGERVYYTTVKNPTTSDLAYDDVHMTTSYAITVVTSNTITTNGYTLTYDESKNTTRLKSGDIWFSTLEPKQVKYCNGTNWEDYKKTIAGQITISSGIITDVIQPFYNLDITEKKLAESYVNGENGYNLYSNGFCEQWGNAVGSITLLKAYKDTNYNIVADSTVTAKYADKFTLSTSAGWQTMGYIF